MMTHNYQISGMTCNSCVAKVKSELLKHPDIISAEISRDPSLPSSITMEKHISVTELQNTIGKAGHYSITEDVNDKTHSKMETGHWLKTYKPLFIVAGFITLVSVFTSFSRGEFSWMHWMNNFMAGFFISFSFFKMLDLRGFADSYSMYDIIAKRWRAYGFIYPFIELTLGFLYVLHAAPLYTNIATVVVMGISSVGVIQSVMDKKQIRCACLGAVFNLPMSTVTIIEDTAMVIMAGIMII